MIAAWYGCVSFMLIVYVILDGRNFGVGMLHWIVARTPAERRQVVAAIGPLWPWDEVWLVAFGGVLVAVFPKLMASAFSGYYLALFLILWCLVLRAGALEIGGHIDDRMWQGFWDFVLVCSSVLLAVLFGAAAGNLARGVPIDAHGNFVMAFFTNFGVRGYVGLLDWYTLSIAVFAALLLAAHGATYLVLKTDGPVHERSVKWMHGLWRALVPALAVVSLETWAVRPELPGQALASPFAWVGTLLVVGSAAALISGLKTGNELRAFLASNGLIAAMLATGAATIFPVVLYSTLAPQNSMTAYAAASSSSAMFMAFLWWPLALVLTLGYYFVAARRYAGKVRIDPQDPVPL